MNHPKIKKRFVFALFIKVTVTILLILIAAGLLWLSFGVLSDDNETDLADAIRYCDRSYYDRDFSDLYNTLTVFDLYTEEFDKYWEAVDVYRTYTVALEWRVALENGYAGADAKLAQAQNDLSDMDNTVKFPDNRSLISYLNTKLNEENNE